MSSSDAPPPGSRPVRPFVVRPTSGSAPAQSAPRPPGRISRPFIPRVVPAPGRAAPAPPVGVARPAPARPDTPAEAPGDAWADRPLADEPATVPASASQPGGLAAERSAGTAAAGPSAGIDVPADRGRELQRTAAGPPLTAAVVRPAEAWPEDVWPEEGPRVALDPATPLVHESPAMLQDDLASDLSAATAGAGPGLGTGEPATMDSRIASIRLAEEPAVADVDPAVAVAERLERLAEQVRDGTLPAGNVTPDDARAGMRDSEVLVAVLGAVLKAGR